MVCLSRAVARGCVSEAAATFVREGLWFGFMLGVDVSLMKGRKRFSNYKSALENRSAVTRAVRKRVCNQKTLHIGQIDIARQRRCIPFVDWRIFPMSAVAKPMEPGEVRPCSDHTRTGLKAATDVESMRHTLDSNSDIARLLVACAYMTVSDVDAAFPLLPVAPVLWPYLLFLWYDTEAEVVDGDSCNELHVHVCADFGAAGVPGTWKIFFSDVCCGMATSEWIITLPMVIHVDDVAQIGSDMSQVDAERVKLRDFLARFGVFMKAAKDRTAAQVQLVVGFWWDSVSRTRTLDTAKLAQYIAMFDEFSVRESLCLRERQSAAGRMQRAVMTMPLGATCFLASAYLMLSGLRFSWQKRRTSSAERSDYATVRDLLRANMGRGFFCLEHFDVAATLDTDASRSRAFTGGGYVSRAGQYRSWRYGTAAARKPIDFLEGDAVVVALEDLGHTWHHCIVPCRIDNQSFSGAAGHGWSHAPRLNVVLRRLFELSMKFECVLQFEWISTHVNVYADALSRAGGEEEFLALMRDQLLPFELVVGAVLRRDPRCGQARQLEDSYSSNVDKDGAGKASRVPIAFSVPYTRASIYTGLPAVLLSRLDAVMEHRLSVSSHSSIGTALKKWDVVRTRHGWERVIRTDDLSRGGKLATFVMYMVDDTELGGASISNYTWALRAWLKFQRQIDPVYGLVEWDDFTKATTVMCFSVSEPRKRVPIRHVRAALATVDVTNFEEVQAALLIVILLFSFCRSETPCPKSHTGPSAFDPEQHAQVCDVKPEVDSVRIRLKRIKQDQRMERPEAVGNEDWVVIGDVDDDVLSVRGWYRRVVQLHGTVRADDAPFFTDAPNSGKSLLYSNAMKQFRRLLGRVMPQSEADTYGLHSLRVEGYYLTKRGKNGEDFAIAHGGWHEGSQKRYDRFTNEEVIANARYMVDQMGDEEALDELITTSGTDRQLLTSATLPAVDRNVDWNQPPDRLGVDMPARVGRKLPRNSAAAVVVAAKTPGTPKVKQPKPKQTPRPKPTARPLCKCHTLGCQIPKLDGMHVGECSLVVESIRPRGRKKKIDRAT